MKKSSIVLYKDQREVVQALTDEQAGKLLKAFYDHLNNKNIKLDTILSLVFIPFKQQFTRDEFKYQNIVKRNRANIKKRWNKQKNKATKNTTGKTGIPDDTKNTDKGERIKDKGERKKNFLNKNTPLSTGDKKIPWEIMDALEKGGNK